MFWSNKSKSMARCTAFNVTLLAAKTDVFSRRAAHKEDWTRVRRIHPLCLMKMVRLKWHRCLTFCADVRQMCDGK